LKKLPIKIDADGFVHVLGGSGLGAEIDLDPLDNNVICKIQRGESKLASP